MELAAGYGRGLRCGDAAAQPLRRHREGTPELTGSWRAFGVLGSNVLRFTELCSFVWSRWVAVATLIFVLNHSLLQELDGSGNADWRARTSHGAH